MDAPCSAVYRNVVIVVPDCILSPSRATSPLLLALPVHLPAHLLVHLSVHLPAHLSGAPLVSPRGRRSKREETISFPCGAMGGDAAGAGRLDLSEFLVGSTQKDAPVYVH